MSRRWIIFILATSHFFLSQFYRTSNAVIAPELIRDLALDTEELGLLSASFFYGFALTQIPISILLDKVGPRWMMTGLSLMGVVGAILFSIADSLGFGLIGRVLLGIGMMPLLGISLNACTVMVGAIMMGIVVDDSVHFLVGLRRKLDDGADLDKAIRETISEVGVPVVITSLILALGFMLLLVGDFGPSRDVGIIAAIIVIAALLADLVLLPAILRTFPNAVPGTVSKGLEAS